MRIPRDLPRLRLTLMTLYAIGGALVALLCAVRFSAEGRRFDLFLCAGFSCTAASWIAYGAAPMIAHGEVASSAGWARLGGNLLGWSLIAYAPFARGVVEDRRAALRHVLGLSVLALITFWILARNASNVLPPLGATGRRRPEMLSGLLALQALATFVTVVDFARRYYRLGEDLDRWLAFGGTLMLFASLAAAPAPSS
jgi:hypothetical protein